MDQYLYSMYQHAFKTMKQETKNIYYSSAQIGGMEFLVFVSHKGITGIHINPGDYSGYPSAIKLQNDDPYLFGVFRQLEEYFDGRRKRFYLPLDIHGTDFQMKVWNELRKIPYGQTISYRTLSERIGDVKAIRAVGKANGANPIPIIIPCHRVINSDGSLGGFSCGIHVKERLLELEGCLTMEIWGTSPTLP